MPTGHGWRGTHIHCTHVCTPTTPPHLHPGMCLHTIQHRATCLSIRIHASLHRHICEVIHNLVDPVGLSHGGETKPAHDMSLSQSQSHGRACRHPTAAAHAGQQACLLTAMTGCAASRRQPCQTCCLAILQPTSLPPT